MTRLRLSPAETVAIMRRIREQRLAKLAREREEQNALTRTAIRMGRVQVLFGVQ